MKQPVLTIRASQDTVDAIDAFAAQRFPEQCPACKGSGMLQSTGTTCYKCGGLGNIGIRADALRYLLQFALGAQATPQAQAMAAAYDNIAPKLVSEMSRMVHKAEQVLHEGMVSAIAQVTPPGIALGPHMRKRKS